jgi:cytochrome d ubiquinol oxidase subunit II
MSTLYVPLTLAAIGIILRGAAFAFRKAPPTLPLERLFGATFASASVITPFCLGAVVGGVASGRVPAGERTGDAFTSWLNPTSLLGGVMAVAVCAFLAAVYLAADAGRRGMPGVERAFRRRALGSGVFAGVVAVAGVAVLHADAPDLFHGLTHRGAPLIVLSAVAGAVTLVMVWKGHDRWARPAAALAVVAVLWGWAAGQYPWMLERRLKIADAAGAQDTLVAMLGTLAVGAAFVLPALIWLFVLQQRGALTSE